MHKNLNIKTFKNLFKIATALLFCFALFANPTKVYGQTLSLSLWPPLIEAMIQPGRSITAAYQLTNNSDMDLLVIPQIYPFEPLGDTGGIKILDTERLPLDANFFSIDSREKFGEPFLLKVGEPKQVVLKITIPKNSPEKDYYHTLLFSTVNLPSLPGSLRDGGGASSAAQIGANILITVSEKGKPALSGKIRHFSTLKIIDSFDKTHFTAILENTGRTLWKPFGSIIITGIFNQKDEIKLLEQNVLAYNSRELTLEPHKPKFPFGPFKAELKLSLNETGTELCSTTAFWYFPYRLLGLILFSLIIFLIVKKIIKLIRKNTNQSAFGT